MKAIEMPAAVAPFHPYRENVQRAAAPGRPSRMRQARASAASPDARPFGLRRANHARLLLGLPADEPLIARTLSPSAQRPPAMV